MANCIIQKISALPMDINNVYALFPDYRPPYTKLVEAYPDKPIKHWPVADIVHQQPASQEVHYIEIPQPPFYKYNKLACHYILFVKEILSVKNPASNGFGLLLLSIFRKQIGSCTTYKLLCFYRVATTETNRSLHGRNRTWRFYPI